MNPTPFFARIQRRFVLPGNVGMSMKKYHEDETGSFRFAAANVSMPMRTNLKEQERSTTLVYRGRESQSRSHYHKERTIHYRYNKTKRPIEESYESEKSKRIVFDDNLPRWNYLIKCS